MGHRIRPLALIAAAVSSLSCASAPRVDVQSEEQAIRARLAEGMAAVAAKDVDRFANLYAPDAALLLANVPIIQGRPAIRAELQKLFSAPNMSFSFASTKIEVAKSGDLAYELGTNRFVADMPEGRVNDQGKYLAAWKKIDGQWMLVADAGNSDLPLPEAPVVVVDFEPSGLAFTASPAASVGWVDANTPGFPPGRKVAVIHGNPTQKGDYTQRIKFPAGYTTPIHTHPESEHITVLSGTFQFGIGERASEIVMVTYGPGDFIYVPKNVPHVGSARTEAVIQLHGIGPTSAKVLAAR